MRVARLTPAMVCVVAATSLLGGCAGSDDGSPGVLRSLDSSWVTGAASLASFPGFLSIANRAEELAAQRFAERKRELALLEAARVAARKRDRQAKLEAYLEAKRRAEAAYRAALRKAAIERRKALAKLRAAQRRRAELLRKLNAELRVPPGEECNDPLIRAHIECRAGKLPVSRK